MKQSLCFLRLFLLSGSYPKFYLVVPHQQLIKVLIKESNPVIILFHGVTIDDIESNALQ